eukprot:4388861-Amphidinium_carterae.1
MAHINSAQVDGLADRLAEVVSTSQDGLEKAQKPAGASSVHRADTVLFSPRYAAARGCKDGRCPREGRCSG